VLNVTVFCPVTLPGPRFGFGGGAQGTLIGSPSADDWFFTNYVSDILNYRPLTEQLN
jgi:hypothetical protein